MSLALEQSQPVPLVEDADGVVHVAGTRVTLDTVVYAFERGATAEEIVQQYPALPLADVYSVLGYLLRHRQAVAAYLAQRAKRRQTVQAENERQLDPTGIRHRLVVRRQTSSAKRK